jgi:hypothetical protein
MGTGKLGITICLGGERPEVAAHDRRLRVTFPIRTNASRTIGQVTLRPQEDSDRNRKVVS